MSELISQLDNTGPQPFISKVAPILQIWLGKNKEYVPHITHFHHAFDTNSNSENWGHSGLRNCLIDSSVHTDYRYAWGSNLLVVYKLTMRTA